MGQISEKTFAYTIQHIVYLFKSQNPEENAYFFTDVVYIFAIKME